MGNLSHDPYNFVLTKDQLLDLFLRKPQKITASEGKEITLQMFSLSNDFEGSGVVVYKCHCLITHGEDTGMTEGVVMPLDDKSTYSCTFIH